jgi:hypothetical protein
MGRRSGSIEGQFAPRLIEMLESPAYRALSLSAHRVLSRIEIELGHHGGNDNGRLPVTFADFEAYGIERHAIAPAIRELAALGFLLVTEAGRAGNAEYRSPNLFRLTFANPRRRGDQKPTHDWRRIETTEAALILSQAARKNKKPVREKTHFSAGNPHRKPNGPVRETPTTGQGGETPTTSISRVGDEHSNTQASALRVVKG